MFIRRPTHDRLLERITEAENKVRYLTYSVDDFKTRLDKCEKFIPATYSVAEVAPCLGQPQFEPFWVVKKIHPILGTGRSQKFPTKGCAQKALDEHFDILNFTMPFNFVR